MFNVGGGKYFIKKQLMWMDFLRTHKPTLCKILSIDQVIDACVTNCVV